MTTLEWLVQGLLLAMLAVFIPMALRLERRVAALRAAGGGLQDGAKGLSEATVMAEAALARLRATAEGSGRMVAERVAAAESLRDDLAFLTERAELLADRLDGLVRGARSLAPEAGRTTEAVPRGVHSEAERDLLRALKGLR